MTCLKVRAPNLLTPIFLLPARQLPLTPPRAPLFFTADCDKDLPSQGQEAIRGYNNRFYTEKANASATCDCCGMRPLRMLPPGLEDNFTSSLLPAGDTIIQWGRDKLFGGL